MLKVRQRGLSLIELMIGIAIFAIVLAMAAPAFSKWTQDSQDRTAAESILNGLQLARVEAVKRNALVRFDLTDAGGLVAWNVGCVNVTETCPATIQNRASVDGAVNARVGVSTAAIPAPVPSDYFSTAIAAGTSLVAGATFNGLGRVDNPDDVTRVDVTNAAKTDARRYVVLIGAGGAIRMCDPALALANNPQGCS